MPQQGRDKQPSKRCQSGGGIATEVSRLPVGLGSEEAPEAWGVYEAQSVKPYPVNERLGDLSLAEKARVSRLDMTSRRRYSRDRPRRHSKVGLLDYQAVGNLNVLKAPPFKHSESVFETANTGCTVKFPTNTSICGRQAQLLRHSVAYLVAIHSQRPIVVEH
jgi:hypothetical protein